MSDIDIVVVVDSVKVLDPNRPIREADMQRNVWLIRSARRRIEGDMATSMPIALARTSYHQS